MTRLVFGALLRLTAMHRPGLPNHQQHQLPMKTNDEIKNLIENLARLARCPAATKGEATTAAAMLVKKARKHKIDLAGYLDVLAKVTAAEVQPQISKPYNAPLGEMLSASRQSQTKGKTLITVMPGGWYRGKTYEEIFRIDPEYLHWFPKAHPTRRKINKSISAFLKAKSLSADIY